MACEVRSLLTSVKLFFTIYVLSTGVSHVLYRQICLAHLNVFRVFVLISGITWNTSM